MDTKSRFYAAIKTAKSISEKPLFENERAYKRQGNICSNLLRRVKKKEVK